MTDAPGPAPVSDTNEALARVVRFYETLSPASLDRIEQVYAPEAYFKDPFNEIRDRARLRAILAHMFEALDAPRFVITRSIASGGEAFLVWDFLFRMRRWQPRIERRIHGASHVRFGPDGRVAYHRDYWDAAEELYEKLPGLGGILRAVKRRLG